MADEDQTFIGKFAELDQRVDPTKSDEDTLVGKLMDQALQHFTSDDRESAIIAAAELDNEKALATMDTGSRFKARVHMLAACLHLSLIERDSEIDEIENLLGLAGGMIGTTRKQVYVTRLETIREVREQIADGKAPKDIVLVDAHGTERTH